MQSSIPYANSYFVSRKFTFLNLEKNFEEIDWNYSDYGKLWTYNLNYFEFLNQKNISKEKGLSLIKDYISKKEDLNDGLEPYPISLRGINWVKFLSKNKIQNSDIDEFLFQSYKRLLDNLEYHLMANHLLENGFSLLFGAYYFKDEKLYAHGKKIVTQQLKEQILNDGAHYELSPMYHKIILHRVLDILNLVQSNNWKNKELKPFLSEKAERMLGFLENISFKNKEIPNMNDAADGIAPGTEDLFKNASELGLESHKVELQNSGYRKFESGDFEIRMDIGQIAPKYQPGHSHADSLQFLLNYKSKPIIVDTGISTYEKNERRQIERSTAAHNTITINDQNSSEVWGGFRVGRRAKTNILEDTPSVIVAQHDGNRNIGILHKRKFSLEDEIFQVKDEIICSGDSAYAARGHLHFHPEIQIELAGNMLYLNKELQISFSGIGSLKIEEYLFAAGFNKLIPAKKIIYKFTKDAELNIMPLFLDTFSSSVSPEDETRTDATLR